MNKLLLSLCISGLLVGCVSTKSPTGRSQTLLFSDAQMQQMGAQSFAAMKKDQKISQNKSKTAYVNRVHLAFK